MKNSPAAVPTSMHIAVPWRTAAIASPSRSNPRSAAKWLNVPAGTTSSGRPACRATWAARVDRSIAAGHREHVRPVRGLAEQVVEVRPGGILHFDYRRICDIPTRRRWIACSGETVRRSRIRHFAVLIWSAADATRDDVERKCNGQSAAARPRTSRPLWSSPGLCGRASPPSTTQTRATSASYRWHQGSSQGDTTSNIRSTGTDVPAACHADWLGTPDADWGSRGACPQRRPFVVVMTFKVGQVLAQ